MRHLVHAHPYHEGMREGACVIPAKGCVVPLVARTHVSHAIGVGKGVTREVHPIYVPFSVLYVIVYVRRDFFARIPIGAGTLK